MLAVIWLRKASTGLHSVLVLHEVPNRSLH
jgi:hypothetical protein